MSKNIFLCRKTPDTNTYLGGAGIVAAQLSSKAKSHLISIMVKKKFIYKNKLKNYVKETL